MNMNGPTSPKVAHDSWTMSCFTWKNIFYRLWSSWIESSNTDVDTSADLVCEEKLSIQIPRFTAINYHLKSAALKLTAL